MTRIVFKTSVVIAVCCLVAMGLCQRFFPGKATASTAAALRADVAKSIETQVPAPGLVTLRVQFGSTREAGGTGKSPTKWDGEVEVSGGKLHRLNLWQVNPQDRIEGQKWALATRRRDPQTAAERKKGHAAMPVIDSALLIDLRDSTPQTELAFKTAQGDFRFKLADVPLGAPAARFLNRLVQVTQTATATTILSAPTEDDDPVAARGPDGKLYVAYVAFTHGQRFRTRASLEVESPSLDFLADPAGGDQVLLLRLDGSAWTGPLPVTPPAQDVYRPAIAVDGSGRVWVFWTAKVGGAWDLYARCLEGDRWADPVALTREPEADLFAAAATDSSGRVWVTWQALRGTNSNILAARQEGTGFGKLMTVADQAANEWMPSIAASADGRVAIAWDTYQKGDYDVYARIAKDGQFGEPIAIATSLEGQMRSTVAFDAGGRLWIAYETTPERWGKDWGPTERWGVGLYQGRSVEVRVWAEGKLWRPAAEFEGLAAANEPAVPAKQGRRGGQLAAPRLAIEPNGRVWLAARSSALGSRTGVGTSWFEHLAWYDGSRWSGEIVCPNTDNLLDNRPALIPDPTGGVILVGSADGRAAAGAAARQPGAKKKVAAKRKAAAVAAPESRWPDAVNNELVMITARPDSAARQVQPQLVAVDAAPLTEPSPEAKAEAAEVARARAARAEVNGKELQLMRGEFHRHTEISPDGGGDGMLTDMWRYALDGVSFDWIGNGDHDNGVNREYSWWVTQKTTDMFFLPGRFTPVYSYERSCGYPDGHRNVVFANRGTRPLPRLAGGAGQPMDDLPADATRPKSPDTLLLYKYLAQFDGVCASHTSGTDMGTDWRDNDRKVEPIVEIFQGCRQNYEMPGAPRSNTAGDSIGGWRPLGFVSLALKKGYRLGFQSSSDHGSTHISFCNCWVEEPTRQGIVNAMKARHVYGSTDNILADVRCGQHFMGDEFETKARPTLNVRLVGTKPFAKVHIVRDGNYVYTTEPKAQDVRFDWTDADMTSGNTSYYYVRGEQEDGELVWASPMWITFKP